jgi:hypothetical protein
MVGLFANYMNRKGFEKKSDEVFTLVIRLERIRKPTNIFSQKVRGSRPKFKIEPPKQKS